MTGGETVRLTLLAVFALCAVVCLSFAIGYVTAPTTTHFTDCRHVIDLVDGHWQHVWKCR